MHLASRTLLMQLAQTGRDDRNAPSPGQHAREWGQPSGTRSRTEGLSAGRGATADAGLRSTSASTFSAALEHYLETHTSQGGGASRLQWRREGPRGKALQQCEVRERGTSATGRPMNEIDCALIQ